MKKLTIGKAMEKADAVLLALVRGRDALNVARQQHNIPLAKQVHDQADAFERWSRRQNLGEDWIGLGHKIKIEALAVIGELLAAMPKQAGGRGRTGGGRNRGSKKELQLDAERKDRRAVLFWNHA